MAILWGFLIGWMMSSHGATLEKFMCNPSPDMPVYLVQKKNDQFYEARVHFPQGVSQAPLHSGDLSADLLSWIQYKADFVSKMGSTYAVEIPVSQCIFKQQDEFYYIHCFRRDDVQIGEQKIRGFSFHASSKKIMSLTSSGLNGVIIEDSEVRVGVDIGVPIPMGVQRMDLARVYTGDECQLTTKP